MVGRGAVVPSRPLGEQGGGQPPGIGVLAGAMIAVEQDEPAGKRVPGAVGEGKIALLQLKRIQDGIMGDAADCQKRGEIGQGGEAAGQEWACARRFPWRKATRRGQRGQFLAGSGRSEMFAARSAMGLVSRLRKHCNSYS